LASGCNGQRQEVLQGADDMNAEACPSRTMRRREKAKVKSLHRSDLRASAPRAHRVKISFRDAKFLISNNLINAISNVPPFLADPAA